MRKSQAHEEGRRPLGVLRVPSPSGGRLGWGKGADQAGHALVPLTLALSLRERGLGDTLGRRLCLGYERAASWGERALSAPMAVLVFL